MVAGGTATGKTGGKKMKTTHEIKTLTQLNDEIIAHTVHAKKVTAEQLGLKDERFQSMTFFLYRMSENNLPFSFKQDYKIIESRSGESIEQGSATQKKAMDTAGECLNRMGWTRTEEAVKRSMKKNGLTAPLN
jgi:hypothetical protein